MSPHVERMVVERDELQGRITRLADFMLTQTFLDLDPEERERMKLQLSYMTGYLNALTERLKAATGQNP